MVVLAASVLASACGSSPTGSLNEHLKKGDDYLAAGKVKEAIVEYKTAVQVDGRSGPARQKLGEAVLLDGDAIKAFKELVFAADLMPDDIKAQIRAGDALLQVNQYEDARGRAEKVLAKDPRNVDAIILKGNALAGLRDMKGALAALEEAAKTDPTRSRTFTNLGALQFVRGDMGQAEVAFKRAVATDPKSVPARLALANLYWSTSRRAEAEQAIKEAISLNPTDPFPNQALALLYLGSNRTADAEEPLRAFAKYAGDDSSQIMLADYYAGVRRLPEAKAIYQQVAAGAGTGTATAKLRLASLGLMDRDLAGAYRLIEEILAKNSRHVEALVARAQLKAGEGKLDEALTSVRSAVAADSSSALAQYVLGLILKATYQIEDAERAFNDALRASPRFAPANVELARIAIYGSKFRDAARYAQAAIDSVPGYGEAYLLLARASIAAGDTGAAEGPLKTLATAFPDSADVQAELGHLLMAKGDAAGAAAAFGKALARNALEPTALEGMVILDVQQKREGAARQRLDAALAKAPKNADIQVLAARMYATALNDASAAEAAGKRALATDPNNLAAYQVLASLHIKANNLPAATVEFQKLADRQPKSVANQTAVGLLLQLQNKPDGAKASYEKALALDPSAPVAANNLAQLYVDRNENLDIALQLAKTAKVGLPNAHEVDDTLGWIYYKKGDGASAAKSLKRAVAAQPDNAVYLYHLGAAYALSKDKTNARLALQKALKLEPTFPGAEDARKILNSLQ